LEPDDGPKSLLLLPNDEPELPPKFPPGLLPNEFPELPPKGPPGLPPKEGPDPCPNGLFG